MTSDILYCLIKMSFYSNISPTILLDVKLNILNVLLVKYFETIKQIPFEFTFMKK